jgi:2-iminoacetate synthase ThiH
MTSQEVLAVAEAGRRAGCKEALFSLGDQPEAVFPEAKVFLRKQGFERTLEYLAAMTRLVLDETGLLPHANPGQTRLFRTGRGRAGSSFEGHLLVHALARLLLNGPIENIQVSWVKLGFETARACLEAGANDFGGTLMEESISKAAGATFGEYASPGELRALIRTIGRTPAERTTTYKIRRLFEHADADELLPLERMAAHRENAALLDQARH